MSALQVYCACGYTVRFTGAVPGASFGRGVLPCPMCARDILASQEVIKTHPVLRALDVELSAWEEASQSEKLAPQVFN